MKIADRRWLGSLALLIVLCGFLYDGYAAHVRAAQWCAALVSRAVIGDSRQAADNYATIPGLVSVYAIGPARSATRPESAAMYIFEGPVAVKWTCFARFGSGHIESATTERGDVSSYGYYLGQQLEWHR